MNRLVHCLLAPILLPLLALPSGWAEDRLAAATALLQGGQTDAAFVACLGLPGLEHAAARLGRADPEHFLPLCELRNDEILPFAAILVKGDLLLALGRPTEALTAYREVAGLATAAATAPGTAFPPDYYPVEPPTEARSSDRGFLYSPSQPLLPWQIGPGSQRDNWLIRRFITLDAEAETAAEFARVWELHRFRTRPYVFGPASLQTPPRSQSQPQIDDAAPTAEYRLVTPAGFDRHGLQFALDYAYFLRRTGEPGNALDVLFEALAAIDLDRNPNPSPFGLVGVPIAAADAARHPRRPFPGHGLSPFGSPVGISRKAFIRLAFGGFKEAVGTASLVARLEAAAQAAGEPGEQARLRHLLAPVHLLADDQTASLAAALAYIDHPTLAFADWTKACRRGLAYEALGLNAEAAAEYERALDLPATPEELPDADEEERQSFHLSAMPVQIREGVAARRQSIDLHARLVRLYAALGEEGKLLDLSLRQLEDNPQLQRDRQRLKQVGDRFQAADRQADFIAWAKRQLETLAAQPAADADTERLLNLALAVDDLELAARHAAAVALRDQSPHVVDGWAAEFRKLGEPAFALYAAAIKAHAPANPRIRLSILDWEDNLDTPAATAAMAAILEADDANVFATGKGVYNPTRFRNYYDLAYRLLRRYQATGDTDSLQALGLRLAGGKKPFAEWWKGEVTGHGVYRNGNDWPEDLNACLALLVHVADSATLRQLQELWRELPDLPATRQLQRRLADTPMPPPAPDLPWANLPAGVRLLAANENVLTVAADPAFIYAGMPWGLAIYHHDGIPVTRLALGDAVQDVLPHAGYLWCATPTGLLRVEPDTWQVRSLPTDADLSQQKADRLPFNRGVWALAADGDHIWIGTRRNLQQYNVRTDTLRIFSAAELGVESHHDWRRFLITERHVWAEGNDILLRYDRASESCSKPEYGPRPVGLIGLFDGQLWGEVWLNDELRARPCRIDPDTLQVTPVLIDDSFSPSERCINGPFSIYGTWNGQPVFGAGYPRFHYDADSAKLHELPRDQAGNQVEFAPLMPSGLAGGTVRLAPGGTLHCNNSITHNLEPVPGFKLGSGQWTLLRLPDRTWLLGARTKRSPRYQYPHEDWPETYETDDSEGGLYLIPDRPDATARPLRISQVAAGNALLADQVFAFLPPTSTTPGWLCSGRGVALLDADLRVAARHTRADGLCANRVVAGLSLDGRTYFATGWGDHGGGLAQYDHTTRIFSGFFQSDGLATDKLSGLELAGQEIALIYDCEYGRGADFRYRRFPPARFAPASGRVTGNGEPRFGSDGTAEFAHTIIQTRRDRSPAPFLGGFVIAEYSHAGQRVLCTTRGVVILAGEPAPAKIEALSPTLRLDPTLAQIEAAAQARIEVASAADLRRYVEADNPYLAAKAVAGLLGKLQNQPELIPLVGQCLDSRAMRTRATALFVLAETPLPEVLPFLRKAAGDADPYLRNVAAIALLKHGEAVAPATVERLFAEADRFGNLPFNVDSSVGGRAQLGQLYHAIAPLATPVDFALMLRQPYRNHDDNDLFAKLGACLRRHPEAAAVLLQAYDHQSPWGAVDFAARVFAAAGPELLPTLYTALQDDNRIVRSNAARACGRLGDPAAIPSLLAALDLESGLSRASIVWALGELKAAAAMPKLVELYNQAMADEQRRAGAGFRAAQQLAVVQDQYASLASLAAIGNDWDELKNTTLDPPVDPQRHEDLLGPAHLLEAAAKIGPPQALPFYRAIAARDDVNSRQQAALHLGQGDEAEQATNTPILVNLLGDPNPRVNLAAAASLLTSAEHGPAEQRLHQALRADNPWEVNLAIEQLGRLRTSPRLAPFLPRLRELATANPTAPRHRQTQENARKLLESLPATQ